jgi:curved DNA-binding protein CbpA
LEGDLLQFVEGMGVVVGLDPIAVLGVRRGLPWAEVRAAYWALARRYHPDGTEPDSVRMAEINAAYEALECEQRLRIEGPSRPHDPAARASVTSASAAHTTASDGRSGPAGDAQPASSPGSPAPGSLLWRIRSARHVETPVLDFGEYAGWHIADIAQHDPRYLRWLSRHSTGIRYRKVIEEVLGPDPGIGRRAAIVT